MNAGSFENKNDIIRSLAFRGEKQAELFALARRVREDNFGRRVEIRSVIEYSNICTQACNYCGMSRDSGVKRYVLGETEFLARVRQLFAAGRRVIMIQSGECRAPRFLGRLCAAIRSAKKDFPGLSLIGSLGSLPERILRKLREAGVERYLLKFETSDPLLYRKVKPSDTLRDRLAHIRLLKRLGFMVSSGNITGLPGQSPASLADDLLLLKRLGLPMGSTSVFIPNNLSNYASCKPGGIDTALNFAALLRILCPGMLIPATSSLELIVKGGQYRGLLAGANAVTLHDGTPAHQESKYVIYKRGRYKPREILFRIVEKAGLIPSAVPLITDSA